MSDKTFASTLKTFLWNLIWDKLALAYLNVVCVYKEEVFVCVFFFLAEEEK